MVTVRSGSVVDAAALARRQALTGASGPRALVTNFKVFTIALFACLGGFVYGYNQGVFSGILTMTSFGNRKSQPSEILGRPRAHKKGRYGHFGHKYVEERVAYLNLRTRRMGRLHI
jgi:hypothetical protein